MTHSYYFTVTEYSYVYITYAAHRFLKYMCHNISLDFTTTSKMTVYKFTDLTPLSHINIQCAATLSSHHFITNISVRFSQYHDCC